MDLGEGCPDPSLTEAPQPSDLKLHFESEVDGRDTPPEVELASNLLELSMVDCGSSMTVDLQSDFDIFDTDPLQSMLDNLDVMEEEQRNRSAMAVKKEECEMKMDEKDEGSSRGANQEMKQSHVAPKRGTRGRKTKSESGGTKVSVTHDASRRAVSESASGLMKQWHAGPKRGTRGRKTKSESVTKASVTHSASRRAVSESDIGSTSVLRVKDGKAVKYTPGFCQKCQALVENPSAKGIPYPLRYLKQHVMKCHFSKEMFECSGCSKKSPFKKWFRTHKKVCKGGMGAQLRDSWHSVQKEAEVMAWECFPDASLHFYKYNAKRRPMLTPSLGSPSTKGSPIVIVHCDASSIPSEVTARGVLEKPLSRRRYSC